MQVPLAMPRTAPKAQFFRRVTQVQLRVIDGPDKGMALDIDVAERSTVLGGRKKHANDLVLNDRHVSDNHFELKIKEARVSLRDLKSTNGVFIGSIQVQEAWIVPGTQFRVGDTLIELVAVDDMTLLLGASEHYERIYGLSPPMQELFAFLRKIAHKTSEASTLIYGETGTGKELVAEALHKQSTRRDHPFVAINCAAIPRDLVESFLFGHVKGSFTGASSDHTGCFEAASRGTLLLDEIGDLPNEVQTKILRALQEKEITRVGDKTPRPVDVRVVAATHRDLEMMVGEGKFRGDLFHRLVTLKVEVPPLRERGDDVLLLAERFLEEAAKRQGQQYHLTPDARKVLRDHSWPGNVRELRNVIDAATVHADSLIGPEHIFFYSTTSRRDQSGADLSRMPHRDAIEAFERIYFEQLSKRYAQKTAAIAKAAKMTPEGVRQAFVRLNLPKKA